MNQKDIYDLEIERLTNNPEDIYGAWESGESLFAFVSPSRKAGNGCGCLTMIRSGGNRFALDESREVDKKLTAQIRKDTRIPTDPVHITVEDLPVFAEWQRKLDKLYNRNPS